MAEITFIADPGVDDILIDGVSLNDIDAFMSECLSGGAVSCGWDVLHTRLTNHDVSRFWWFLTDSERRSIAKMAIENTMLYNIRSRRFGANDCAGGSSTWEAAICTDNALIRYFKFTLPSFEDIDSFYWKHPVDLAEYCYVPNNCFKLPGHTVGCANFDTGFFHHMCSIHIKQGIGSIDDWIIFNYRDIDIKPGHWQMPLGSTVRMYAPYEILPGGYKGDLITSFYEV